MVWQYTPYTVPLLLVGIGTAITSIVVWMYRAKVFSTVIASISVWSFAQALQLSMVPYEWKLFWMYVVTVSAFMLTASVFVFTLDYTGRYEWMTFRRLLPIGAVGSLIVIFVWTNSLHNLIWQDIELVQSGSVAMLDYTWGPGVWLIVLPAYSLLLASVALLVPLLLHSRRIYRKQTTFIVAGIGLPWMAHVTTMLGYSPFPHMTLTPLVNSFSGILVFIGVFGYDFVGTAPKARDIVVNKL
ncbi:MAG: histidine kinase N-terminal 7TM domain-containing protein, partial [Halobacteria archaeon]|nr:histidine kinase N-terminal 7TM domain-containing protein [Halobacteria archaeon]